MCPLSLFEASPEVDDPGAAPSCMSASSLKPALERHSRGSGQFRRASQSDLIARMQREQVRNVAVTRIRLIIVFEPLLQLSVLADLERRQPVARRTNFRSKFRIHSKHNAGFDYAAEERIGNLRVHSWSHTELGFLAIRQPIAILGRNRRPYHQATFTIINQIIEQELCSLLHHGIGAAGKELAIAGEIV